MFDLSPEKLMALLAIGLLVLGPQRLPTAARSLAQGLAKARRLAATLTDPLQASLAEPRQHLEAAVAEVRGTVEGTLHPISSERLDAHTHQVPVEGQPFNIAAPSLFDPSEN
jgi:Sec-independent protein translocase protein TatA